MNTTRRFYVLSFLLISQIALGQEENKTDQDSLKSDPDSSGVVSNALRPTSTPILLFTALEDEEKAKKEKKKKTKKKKKNIYFGERTQRSAIKQSFRDQLQTQYFHYTQRNQQVDPYIRDIYWYDPKEKVIRTKNFDPNTGYLLHGPFEKRVDDVVVESGMFYFGTKHGRWMTFDGKNTLLDKSNYYEGWPKASKVSYYNRSEQIIEKVTPIEYDLEEGNFYHFYENGEVAVVGEYKFGEKIGLWTEYWNNTGDKTIRKREIQYQEEPFTKGFKPYIRAEWDKEGNLIYRNDS
jgi:antitoxin component YwqK of YwqJK toxin-antitoxin module